MENRNWGDFDLSELESKESPTGWIPSVLVKTTNPKHCRISFEGPPAYVTVVDENGNRSYVGYELNQPVIHLQVLGYSDLVYARVKRSGVEIMVGTELAFSVKSQPPPQVISSPSGQTIKIPNWNKRDVGYDPLEGEVEQTMGILTHVYATDGEKLFVIEIKRGNFPDFDAYKATSTEAKQAWTAYLAYLRVLKEPTKERIDALMSALAPFPEILKKAEECFSGEIGGIEFANVSRLDKEALKEKVEPALRKLARENYLKFLLDFISENHSSVFASTPDGAKILRSGGMLTGSIAVTDKKIPMVIALGKTLVPHQNGVREGMMVLSLITVDPEKGACYFYGNNYQNHVLAIARGYKNDETGKLYDFLRTRPVDEYKELYQSLKDVGLQPVSPNGAVSFLKQEQFPKDINPRIKEVAKRYGDAFGGFNEVDTKHIKIVWDNLTSTVHKLSSPTARAENKTIQALIEHDFIIEDAVQEFKQDQTEEKKRGSSFRQGN